MSKTEDKLTAIGFMPRGEWLAIREGLSGEERAYFVEVLAKVAEVIATMPRTYGQDGKGDQAIAYLHYFGPNYDAFLTELDAEGDGTEQAFGLACFEWGEPELGYISIAELVQNGVELDLHWTPKTIAECKADLAVRS